MADNDHKYGFRWSTQANGRPCPHGEPLSVASAYDGQDASANSVDLNVGDPVKRVADGTIALAAGGDTIYGIIVGFGPYWDGSKMVRGTKLPNANTWGTVQQRRPFVYVVPAKWGTWEIDCDSGGQPTTEATWYNDIGAVADHVLTGDTALTSADPYLDISSAADTAAAQWTIVGLSPTLANQDFSGANFKVLVRVNESHEPGAAAVGSIADQTP